MSRLKVSGLRVEAGRTRILDDVSLTVEPRSILAVVGPNGAGKTTLLDAISIGRATAGTIRIDGDAGVARVFQGSPLPETLTVGETLSLVAGRDARELMLRFGLLAHESSFVSELSTGMRRILDLAVAVAGTPEVLLLDEPSSGLARAEIGQLADLLRSLRDRSDVAIVLVEHDAWLVRAVADRALVLDEGRVVAEGTPDEVLAAHRVTSGPRVTDPRVPSFASALEQVTASAAPAPTLVRRSLSTWTILRLGLRQFAAGLASMLVLGVLSRVLHYELGISLAVVTAVLGAYNLAAPIGLPIGHVSDTRPIGGLRRVPYVVAGAAITGVAVAAAPHVAGRIGADLSPAAIALSLGLFVAMGAGMYGAGTAFFALISDIASPAERGHVARAIYLELLAGVFFGLVLTGTFVRAAPAGGSGALPDGTTILFALAGAAIFVLSVLAVWGTERRSVEQVHPATPRPRFGDVVRSATRIPQARAFFAFMTASTAFMFVQQGILQPFGARVFTMSVAQTSGLTAMLTLGTIVGMVFAGRPFAAQVGHKRMARAGLLGSVAGFGALAAAAVSRSAPGTWLSLLGVGLAIGVFNVASLSMMMGMATRARAAFFMGAWTVAHALADGLAAASGGALYSLSYGVAGAHAPAYAVVFALEAVGLALCLPLLSRVDPGRFAHEAGSDERAVSPDAPARGGGRG